MRPGAGEAGCEEPDQSGEGAPPPGGGGPARPPMSLHLVFLGNPGTGKTTVARLLARLYHAIGVLPKGQLVEVDRSGLVAGFVGQTALKTQEVIQKAIGGVLFIDEAYALVNQDNGNDFGREVIEVLLKNMEDHRKDLVVIVAGYSQLMEKFIHSNPGLESRFNKYFYFEDYDGAQLFTILQSMCVKNGYVLTPEGEALARRELMALYEDRDENFGNARDVRNLFEQAVARQSDRVARLEAPTREQLMALRPEDLRLAVMTGDAKAISRAPGVGAKTAQRIILDLKDKVQAEDLLTPLLDGSAAVSPAAGNGLSGNAAKEAVEALVALGYTNAEAVKAVKSANVTEEMDSEAVLKASLKYLAFL